MTILMGDTGKVALGTLKTFSFEVYMTEDALGTLPLPNSEGSTNQVAYTIQQAHLPSVNPIPYSMKYIGVILVSGRATTACNISYRIFKNGVSIASASVAVASNQYWSWQHNRWYDVQVGDVLEVRMWSNQADSTMDYSCLKVYPANVVLTAPGTLMKDFTVSTTVTGGTANPNPTGLGLRTSASVSNIYSIFTQVSNAGNSTPGVGNGNGCIAIGDGNWQAFPCIMSHSLGSIRLGAGGDTASASSASATHATDLRYFRPIVPSTVTFRELNI